MDPHRGGRELTVLCFFFQAEDGIRDYKVTGVQTCALPICTGTRIDLPARTARASSTTSALRAAGQSMHPTATGRSATRIGRSEPRSPACSRVGSQQSDADDDQHDADPPRTRYPLLQEALGKDRDDDESDAADRESGADLDELQSARIDQCLQAEQRDSSADPQLLAVRRQRRALEKHLRDALDDAAQDDQQYPDRGRGHCRIALRARLSWSVRLMNQTPANTNPMPSTLSVSTLSPR